LSSRWPAEKEAPAYPWMAPSILASNFARLADEVRRAEDAGVEILHLDVMDGHFVPNLTFGAPVVAAIRRVTNLPLDVHLMIEKPDALLDAFIEAGADNITMHVEAGMAKGTHEEALARIRAAGVRAGLSLRPATPFERIEPHLGSLDLLLVMSVDPGFGGQPFMPEALPRLERARKLRAERRLRYWIEVDGGIDPRTAPGAVASGAEVLVAGTALYGSGDMSERVAAMRQAVRAGWGGVSGRKDAAREGRES
jgi:ribulose-phosphate 3-epimerase